MDAKFQIARFFEFVDKDMAREEERIARRVVQIQSFGEPVAHPDYYDDMAEAAWAAHACRVACEGRGEIVDLYTFKLMQEGLQRSLISFAAQYRGRVPENPAYWRQIGRLEQEAARLIAALEVEGV